MIFSFCHKDQPHFIHEKARNFLTFRNLSQNSDALTPIFNNLSSIYLDCLSIYCLLPELLAAQPSVTQPSVTQTACHPNNWPVVFQTCVMLGQLALPPMYSSVFFHSFC
uniref:Uncharacterized protein n=1 Tax=Populus davidiana TaxID=266767 RepID=A0A6M2EXK9_9ROSI